jgi:hypothetical protein
VTKATGIIGHHVALVIKWEGNTPIEITGEVVACDLRDDVFMLLVAHDDGSLVTVPDQDVRIIGAAEFKRLLRNERRRSQKVTTR